MDRFKNILYEIRGEVVVVRVPCRDFVLEQAQDVVELVFEGEGSGYNEVVLDLGEVNYINSSGISVVIRLNLEKQMRLVKPSHIVSEILELTGVLPFVPTCPTVEEAVASFQK